jgi:hypothetical protein
MADNEEQRKKTRVVVNTPETQREYESTETARAPERRGISGGTVAALVVGVVALMTILFLFVMNRQSVDDSNANMRLATTAPSPASEPPPVIVQQPAPQQPVIIQQPAPSQPIIVPDTGSATGSDTGSASRSNGPDDSTVQSNVDKRLTDDNQLASLGLIAMVVDGKVTLTGTVPSPDLKTKAERDVKAIKGVRSVDNQIIVSSTTSSSSPY